MKGIGDTRKGVFVKVRRLGTSKWPYCVACIKSSRFILTLRGFSHLKSLGFPSSTLSLTMGSIFASEKKRNNKELDNLSTSKTQLIFFSQPTHITFIKAEGRCEMQERL